MLDRRHELEHIPMTAAESTNVVEDIKQTITTDGDHDLFAHYVKKEALEKAIFDGVPALALCGKLWLPTKDAMRYPVCTECKEIWEALGD